MFPFEPLFGAPFGPVILGWALVGVGAQAGGLWWMLRRAREFRREAEEVARLAAQGEPERARIRARAQGGVFEPLVGALMGRPEPVVAAPVRPTLVAAAFGGFPLVPVVAAAFASLPPWTVLALAVAIATLLPGALLLGRAAVLVHRQRARHLRRIVAPLVAQNMRAAIERERSAALRQAAEFE